MPINFKIPASPAVQIYENDTFLGADFTTDLGNVDDTKSPDVVNMIRSIPGKVRKRMGYKQVGSFVYQTEHLPIYGVHYFSFADCWVIHAGKYLFRFAGGSESLWFTSQNLLLRSAVETENRIPILFESNSFERPTNPLYSSMAENRSTACELNQKLIILDGKKMLSVSLITTSGSVSESALYCCPMEEDPNITIPVVRISCGPTGEGTDYQAFNLLTPRFEQDFIIQSSQDPTSTIQLYTDKLAADTVEVKVLNQSGNWINKTENVSFKVNRGTGVIQYGSYRPYPITASTASASAYDFTTTPPTQINTGIDIDSTNNAIVKFTVYWQSEVVLTELYVDITVTANGVVYEAHKLYTNVHGTYIYGEGSTWSNQIDFSEDVEPSIPKVWTPANWPVTPVPGQDNIKVKASYIPTTDGANVINHCRFGVLFGVNGATDRLFVSGNPDYGTNYDANGNVIGTYQLKNRDWYSEQYDPTYFPDTGYSVLGSDTSAIMGYAVVNSYLATFKDEKEMSQTVFIREGDLITEDLDGDNNQETKPVFKLINTLQGAGAISSYCFDYLEIEPIFLSSQGIYSLTSQDITGEKYAQNRSYYLNAKLLQEPNLQDAMGFTWNDYYVLCVNNHIYILDGLQPLQTDKGAPYAIRQYVSFYFEFPLLNLINPGEKITYIWTMYDYFYFGTSIGRIMRFYKDEKSDNSYRDEGFVYPARWTTPDIAGKLFYKNKTFRYVALKVNPDRDSSVKIEVQKNGVWETIKEDLTSIKWFSFDGLKFAGKRTGHPRFSFICDRTLRLIPTKVRIKKVDKVAFRFSNNDVEPLGLNSFALEYTQGGNIK